MEIGNAVLLQRVKARRERRSKLSENLGAIERGSRYRVVGELSLDEVCQHPTLTKALEQFGDVDLVLAESYDAVRGQFGLFDDFLEFEIKLAFIDDIMGEIYVIEEQALSDPLIFEFINMNTEEIKSLAAVGKYKLKQALRGYEESLRRPLYAKTRETDEQIYQAMVDIVRSGEAVSLGGISKMLRKKDFKAKDKNKKDAPLHERQLLRIADRLGKAEEFSELRRSHRTKRRLTPRRNGSS